MCFTSCFCLRKHNWGYLYDPRPQLSKTSFSHWSWEMSASFCFAEWGLRSRWAWETVSGCVSKVLSSPEKLTVQRAARFPQHVLPPFAQGLRVFSTGTGCHSGCDFPPCWRAVLSQLAESRHGHWCHVLAWQVSWHHVYCKSRWSPLQQWMSGPRCTKLPGLDLRGWQEVKWQQDQTRTSLPRVLLCGRGDSAGWVRGSSIQRSRHWLGTKPSSVNQWVFFNK